MAIKFDHTVPILRIFDVKKAREFYAGFLGMKVEFEHRFDRTAPLYMGLSRGTFRLHLSEHHGDGSPGANMIVWMESGVSEYCKEIAAKRYRFYNPHVEPAGWDPEVSSMRVTDPFGNRLNFCGRDKPARKRAKS